MENLERSIADLIKRNANLEDKFDRVVDFFVCVKHSMTTMLDFMQCNKDGAIDDKEVETPRSLHDSLVND